MTLRPDMPGADTENGAKKQPTELRTPADYRAQCIERAAELAETAERRQRASADAEAVRFEAAQAAVLADMMRLRESGLSDPEAGKDLLFGWGQWRKYTYSDLCAVLRLIGYNWGRHA